MKLKQRVMEKDIMILVVEDSLVQAVKLKHILEQQDYRVSVAKDGEEALAAMKGECAKTQSTKQDRPTIVISDIIMPGMDGYELCRRIKADENLKDIPVILLTQLSDPQDIIKGLECGADNFITKPYDGEFLLSRIKHILVNRELRRNIITDMSVEIYFEGKRHSITSDRMQILDLLLATYETVIQKNQELEQANNKLFAMKRELEKQNIKLAKLNEQKNQFIGMAAHDLRSPLSVILWRSQLLLELDEDALSEEQRLEFLSTIKSNSEFMLQLIDDLLDISVIEAGKLELNLQRTDLISLIKHNVELNRALAERKQIKLLFSCNEQFPEMMVDANKIEQVLNNLISNAIKFSYPHSAIEIQVARSEDSALISVRDEGKGISQEELNKLFKPYTKASVKGTKGEKGTGLGLAIVKKVVEGHRGKIWVESEFGKGSTFYVSLPINL
ncbi:MAG: ATP-binding protein [Candidatus Poribacteria bacterium]